MSESTRTSRAPAEKRLTYQQWKRRKMLRLARNWVLFLAGCAAVVALLTGGILWLLPKVHGLLAGPKVFAASVYDGTDYVFNAADARLVLVNANLPYTAEPAPLLDTADEATGQQLEAEAAMQYRSMAAAAQADGVSLTLVAGYQDADTRQAAYEARVQISASPRRKPPVWRLPSSPPPTPTSTAPATRQISSARTIRSRTPVLPRPAPTSGLRPTRRNTALSCATRRTGRPRPASCSSRGTGAMWGWKTPLPSAPAA